jgi:hypothetical protein
MITFAPMPPLAVRQLLHTIVRAIAVVVPISVAIGGVTPSAQAQAPLSHTDDAAPVPAGSLRLRITTAWTRADERFAPSGGTEPFNAELSATALGAAQFPLLAPTQAGLQTLAGDPSVRLSLGRLEVRGGARVATTPISLEYGVTRRWSVGVQVPIVQTRRVVQLRVNLDTSALANVGWLPVGTRSTAAVQNGAVMSALNAEADRLAKLITDCAANPGAGGCAPVNANPAGAAAARDQARAYALAAGALGTDAANAYLAPRQGSGLATAIEARRVAINQALQQYLGAGAGTNIGVFLTTSNFSYVDLQGRNGTAGLLQSALGGGLDSMHTADRIGIGDIAVGTQFLVFDHFARGTTAIPRLQSRMIVGAALRFATSQADSARDLVDIAPGEGAGVEVHGAADLLSGRFGGTVAARYVKAFARTVTAPLYGDPEGAFPFPVFAQRRRTAGDVAGFDLTPRYFLSDWMSINALYGVEHVGQVQYDTPGDGTPCANCQSLAYPDIQGTGGVATTAQRFGVGFRFSTADAYARGQVSFPVEVSFSHLETVSGTAGLPKSTRDQIQVRLYYRLRRAD